jgi:hypothetical protein
MPMQHASATHETRTQHHYLSLGLMALLHFGAMYALMYAMVNTFGDVYSSLNQLYMAGLMTSPMLMLELLLMSSMYENRRLNLAIIAGAAIVGIAFFVFIRNQSAIGDEQFIRSMIPHHSGAILMCERASIQDAELKQLCGTIVAGQQAEIDQLRAKLAALGG